MRYPDIVAEHIRQAQARRKQALEQEQSTLEHALRALFTEPLADAIGFQTRSRDNQFHPPEIEFVVGTEVWSISYNKDTSTEAPTWRLYRVSNDGKLVGEMPFQSADDVLLLMADVGNFR